MVTEEGVVMVVGVARGDVVMVVDVARVVVVVGDESDQ